MAETSLNFHTVVSSYCHKVGTYTFFLFSFILNFFLVNSQFAHSWFSAAILESEMYFKNSQNTSLFLPTAAFCYHELQTKLILVFSWPLSLKSLDFFISKSCVVQSLFFTPHIFRARKTNSLWQLFNFHATTQPSFFSV